MGWWISERQVKGGGLNGRPEKLPDSCYGWWDLSPLAIIGKLDWIDRNQLIDFLLGTQDADSGGFADRKEDATDVYHTCFSLAGLSLLQFPNIEPVDPRFCLPLEVTQKMKL